MQCISTKGNWFRKGDERFLIKGVQYDLRQSHEGSVDRFDVLADENLPNLRRDIPWFLRLGVNTIQVHKYDSSKQHDTALEMLAHNNLYVILDILDLEDESPGGRRTREMFKHEFDENFDTSEFYSIEMVTEMLKTVEQTSHHPNILAYQIDASLIGNPRCSKLAEIVQAAARDAKHYLALCGRRRIPVGVAIQGDIMMMLKPQLHYFTAGNPQDRSDFFALSSYSWAGSHSSFEISGWKSLLENVLSKVPSPMYFTAYGSAMYRPRTFEETLCVFSPDCTGVLSGGGTYTYLRAEGTHDYGLVEILKTGRRRPWHDFWNLRKRLKEVATKSSDQVANAEVKNYEGWVGDFPPVQANAGGRTWLAGAALPPFPGDWEEVAAAVTGKPVQQLTLRLKRED